jgi:hypothetical protein
MVRPFAACVIACFALAQTLAAATLTVVTTSDSGAGSLRAAVASAADGDLIQFDLPTPTTISLLSPLVVSASVTVQGLGARGLTLDGGNGGVPTPVSGTRIFDIQGGTTVAISGLNLANAYLTGAGLSGTPAGANGAAIRIASTTAVTIDACTFQGNYADPTQADLPVGGAIYNNTGTLVVTNSSFFNNTAGLGAAVYNNAGSVSFTNCTINANTSAYGGAVFHVPQLLTTSFLNCTFTGNASVDNGEGGGPSVLDGTITLENTLLSLNSPDAGNNNIDLDASWIPLGVTGTGAFVSLGHNLISNLGTVTALAFVSQSSDLTGSQAGGALNADLATFDAAFAFGGMTPTRPIQVGSPAINAADGSAPVLDQRRYSRPGAPDIGAFAFNGSEVTRQVSGTSGARGATLAWFDGAAETATADGSANFNFAVPLDWSGRITATATGYVITPAYLILQQVQNDTSGLAFSATLNPPGAAPATAIAITGFTANWVANPAAVNYFLDVATDPGFSNLVSGYANLSVGNVSSFLVTGLTGGTTYYYQVRASDTILTSLSSTATTVTTLPQIPTTTTLTASPSPAAYGQLVTLTATVSGGATGSVTFKDGAATLGSGTLTAGVATLNTSSLSVGGHTLTAVYCGSPADSGSTSIPYLLTVTQATSVTTLTASPSPAAYGQLVTLTATVTSGATGTVTFKDGATPIGSGTVTAGTATLNTSSLSVGAHSLTAVYSGDGNFIASSGTASLTVNMATSTTVVTASPNPATYGQSVTLTAAVPAGATGTVTFKDGTTTLGMANVSAGSAVLANQVLAIGGNSISGTYSGDSNYNGSSGTTTLTVNPAASVTTVGANPSPSTYGQTVTFTATVTAAGATGLVTFKDGANTIGSGTLTAGQATFATAALAGGAHTITAVYGGNSDYNGSSGTTPLTVNQAGSTTTLGANPSPAVYGQPVTLTATVTSGATGSVTFKDGAATLGSGTLVSGMATFTTGSLAAAAHSLTAVYGGDGNYAGSTGSATLTVTAATPALTWAKPAAIPWGTALGATQLDATSSVPGSFIYTPPAGTVLGVGTGQTLNAAFTPTDTVDYKSASTSVLIDVVPATQTITFPALPGHFVGDAPFSLGATASSGLTVSYTSSNTSVASVSGNLVTILSAGSTMITASQGGDAQYAPAANASQTLQVGSSKQPPQVQLSALEQGVVTSVPVANISALAQSANGLGQATVNGVAAVLNPDGSFSTAVQLRDGANTLTVVVTDLVGLSTTVTRSVTLDTTMPTLTLTAPSDRAVVQSPALAISGTVDANQPEGDPADPVVSVTVSLNGAPPQPATLTGTSFQASVQLAAGWNQLDFIAVTAGNRQAQVTRTVILTSGNISVAITDPGADAVVTTGSQLVQGTVSATTAATITLVVGSQTYTPAVVNGAFQQQVTLPAVGTWGVQVTAQDQIGGTALVSRYLILVSAAAPSGYTMADVNEVFQIALGLEAPTPDTLAKYDLAPVVDGVPLGQGVIDIQDVYLVFRLANGLPL